MKRYMHGPRTALRLLTVAAIVMAALGSVALSGQTVGQAARAMPIPAVTGHILGARWSGSTPPSTSWCIKTFGISCYNPAQIRRHYDMGPLYAQGLNGAGRTIVIVDAFGAPNIQADLHQFDQDFGLPDPPSFNIIQPAGPVPAWDPNNPDMPGWAIETQLDVEWSHAMAPGANILLVETPVAETEGVQGFPEIVKAENYVIDHNLGDVISQSFGATEQTFPNANAILSLRSAYVNADRHDVTVLAASGDTGSTDYFLDLSCCYLHPVNSWPSSDPLVTSVGGTKLTLDDAGNTLAPDVVWNDFGGYCCAGGGGLSSVFDRPSYQSHVMNVVGDHRGTPDISMSAAVDGGAWVYIDWPGIYTGYGVVGGTSWATPLFAGVVAIADQAAGKRLGLLNHRLYKMLQQGTPGLVDVMQGNNALYICSATCSTNPQYTLVQGYNAGPGYDLASGVGTIDAASFVHNLLNTDNSD